MRVAVLVAAMLSLAAAPQEIYRWVDKDGVVHYSDQPGSPNAERVELADPTTYQSDNAAVDYAPSESSSPRQPQMQYSSLVITSPAPDQTFSGGDVKVQVSAAVGGGLQEDHQLVFYVDDVRRPATDGMGLTLTNVYRGTHYVRASVIDQDGVAVITSAQIAFHVQQRSTQNPRTRNQPTVARPIAFRPMRNRWSESFDAVLYLDQVAACTPATK